MSVTMRETSLKPFHGVMRLLMLRMLTGQSRSVINSLVTDFNGVWAILDPDCRHDLDELQACEIKPIITRLLSAASIKAKTDTLLVNRNPLFMPLSAVDIQLILP